MKRLRTLVTLDVCLLLRLLANSSGGDGQQQWWRQRGWPLSSSQMLKCNLLRPLQRQSYSPLHPGDSVVVLRVCVCVCSRVP